MTPTEVAQAYFAAVDGKDGDALEKLFAEDGEFHVGDEHVKGNGTIRHRFEAETFAREQFGHELRHVLTNGDMVAVVIEAHLGDARYDILDFFTVADGRIARLNIYQGPTVV
jgi:ketosteroid isomerase-like protein